MKKQLILIATITTPIIALYCASPILIFKIIDFLSYIQLTFMLSINVSVVWMINIYLTLKNPNRKILHTFLMSYIMNLLVQISIILPIEYLFHPHKELPQKYLAYPLLTSLFINLIIGIISNLIAARYLKVEAEKAIQDLKYENLESEKKALVQQLQPHFLFNALSNLKSMVATNHQDSGNYIISLSNFLRYTIQSNQNFLVTLEEELSFTSNYIDLQKIRFGNALVINQKIDSHSLTYKLPSFAIQSCIENAIKHNTFTEQQPLYIELVVQEDAIVIQNNKQINSHAEKNGTGIENLQKRYKLMMNKNIQIEETKDNFKIILHLQRI